MGIDDILDISIEALVACVALPFVLKFGIMPWYNIGGLDSQLEKTAIRTNAELSDVNPSFTAADAYLALAIADNQQPSPKIIRYYINPSSTITSDSLTANSSDGLTSLTSGDCFRLSTDEHLKPNTITDKRTIGQKIIGNTDYILSDNVSLMLHPYVDASTDGELAWSFNLKQSDLTTEEATRCKKHGWVYYP